MFEFDAGKLIIIGMVALIVIGPKELPRVMRHVGEVLAKMRRMGAEFRAQFLEAMREAEFDDVKSGVEKIAADTKPELGGDPLAQIKAEISQALEAAEKPGAVPATGKAILSAPQEQTPEPALTAPAMAPLADVEDPNDPRMRALSGETVGGSGAAAPGQKDAALEKAQDHR